MPSTPASRKAAASDHPCAAKSGVQPHRHRARNLEVVRQTLHLLAIAIERRYVVTGADIRSLLQQRQHLLIDLLALFDVRRRPTVGHELIELGIAELAILPRRTALDAALQHVAIDQRLESVAREAELELTIGDDADVDRAFGAHQFGADAVGFEHLLGKLSDGVLGLAIDNP